jgi:hypothetical protein
MSRTSWSDDDLEKLSRKKNHRVRYNGHNYIWEHRLKGNKWEKHSIDCYDEYRKPLHEIHYWTYNYGKELSERQSNVFSESWLSIKVSDCFLNNHETESYEEALGTLCLGYCFNNHLRSRVTS